MCDYYHWETLNGLTSWQVNYEDTQPLFTCFIHFFACKLNICFSLNAPVLTEGELKHNFFLKFLMQDFDSNGGSTMLWVMEQRW